MVVWDNENKWKKEKKMNNSIWGMVIDNIFFFYNGKYNFFLYIYKNIYVFVL